MEIQNEVQDLQKSHSFHYGVAFFGERIGNTLLNTYEKSTVGWGLNIGHKLSNSWYGSISLRTNSWEPKKYKEIKPISVFYEKSNPIFILSRIDYAPPLSIYKDFIIRPVISGGAGVLWFREKFYKLLRVSKKEGYEHPEPAVQFGVGTRLELAPWLQLRVSMEWWSGVRTSRYSGYIWYVECLTGDL